MSLFHGHHRYFFTPLPERQLRTSELRELGYNFVHPPDTAIIGQVMDLDPDWVPTCEGFNQNFPPQGTNVHGHQPEAAPGDRHFEPFMGLFPCDWDQPQVPLELQQGCFPGHPSLSSGGRCWALRCQLTFFLLHLFLLTSLIPLLDAAQSDLGGMSTPF